MTSQREPETPAAALELLSFWFGDSCETGVSRREWWAAEPAFDDELRQRFGELHERAARGELEDWGETPHGLLALVILLDQLSRNLHRKSAAAFANDAHALRWTRRAIVRGWDDELHPVEATFLYLPLEHSEERDDQDECVRQFGRLYEETAGQFNTGESLRYAREHRDIIRRFGRFPHRNEVLGRRSTPAEREYLDGGGQRFGQ